MSTRIDAVPETIEYPDSDGLPMAENKEHLVWIFKLFHGVEALFRHHPKVFVGSDMFWYPVKGNASIRTAPDVMVVFDRNKDMRRSYRQWEEEGIAPHVVIEFRSPGNTDQHMVELFNFYQTYDVEEYYVYDLTEHTLEGWRRSRRKLVPILRMDGHTSPRLGIRFDMSGNELVVRNPDGTPFLDSIQTANLLESERELAESEREKADEEKQRADKEKQRADKEKQRADKEKQRADLEARNREALIAKLRAMGIDPEKI